ncbi:substrate-binding domain-containing protein [Flavicella sediminum]|uniref:substrate-binding domain-containing protein n=1 Tax=Flavicella sediminum TaxID=2585141 RepID=UPI00111EA6FE|nr:substrate-binding domain-containing protein [Flavicella sediminum]
MMKKYTIKDIAELAGVSKGTVDRVLHKRGKVSDSALKKVNKVLEEIEYKPNPIAKSLKNNKVYKVCILFPQSTQDSFWTPCISAVEEIENNYQAFGIAIEQHRYDSNSPSSFLDQANSIISTKPNALLMAPLFYKEAQEVKKNCLEKEIIISTFNNMIDKNSLSNYIGQDLFQSGRIAAKLLDSLTNSGHMLIVHIDEQVQNATHMQEKEKGFKKYFEEKKESHYKVSTISINKEQATNYAAHLQQYFNSNSDINGVFVTTSKTYIVAKFNKENYKKLKIVGYDLVEKNIDYLQQGSIDFLINQNPKKQAFQGLSNLAEHLLFGKEIPKAMLLPIDIINSENYKEYLE